MCTVVVPADWGVGVAEWEYPGVMNRRIERGGSRERRGRYISNLERTCGSNTLKMLGKICTEVWPADKCVGVSGSG